MVERAHKLHLYICDSEVKLLFNMLNSRSHTIACTNACTMRKHAIWLSPSYMRLYACMWPILVHYTHSRLINEIQWANLANGSSFLAFKWNCGFFWVNTSNETDRDCSMYNWMYAHKMFYVHTPIQLRILQFYAVNFHLNFIDCSLAHFISHWMRYWNTLACKSVCNKWLFLFLNCNSRNQWQLSYSYVMPVHYIVARWQMNFAPNDLYTFMAHKYILSYIPTKCSSLFGYI